MPGFDPVTLTVAVTDASPLSEAPSAGAVIQIVTVYDPEPGLLVAQPFPTALTGVKTDDNIRLITTSRAKNTLRELSLFAWTRSVSSFIIHLLFYKSNWKMTIAVLPNVQRLITEQVTDTD